MVIRSYKKCFRLIGFGIRQLKTNVCNFYTESKVILKHKMNKQCKIAFDLHCVKVRQYHLNKKQLIEELGIKTHIFTKMCFEKNTKNYLT